MGIFDAMINQLADALAQRLVAVMRGEAGPRSGSPRAAPKASSAAAVAVAPRGRRRKGQKRDPAFLASTTESLLEYVGTHQGERIEQIAKAMRVATKDLKLPAAKLLANRQVKTRGAKRGTKYYLS